MRQKYKTIDNWQLIISKLLLSLYLKKHIMELQVGKSYRVKNDIFSFEESKKSILKEGFKEVK